MNPPDIWGGIKSSEFGKVRIFYYKILRANSISVSLMRIIQTRLKVILTFLFMSPAILEDFYVYGSLTLWRIVPWINGSQIVPVSSDRLIPKKPQ